MSNTPQTYQTPPARHGIAFAQVAMLCGFCGIALPLATFTLTVLLRVKPNATEWLVYSAPLWFIAGIACAVAGLVVQPHRRKSAWWALFLNGLMLLAIVAFVAYTVLNFDLPNQQ